MGPRIMPPFDPCPAPLLQAAADVQAVSMATDSIQDPAAKIAVRKLYDAIFQLVRKQGPPKPTMF
jgi:hypothetical protein